jgi:hypothetical protein
MHHLAPQSTDQTMIADEMERAVDSCYPDSVLHGTYDFVELKGWRWIASTLDTGATALQIYEDLFRSEERLFVTCVELDLAAYLPPGTRIEERPIYYTPDWNASHTLKQRFAVVRGQELDAGGFFGAVIGSYHAAYVFCPRTGYALTYNGCFAASEEGRAELQRRYPERAG